VAGGSAGGTAGGSAGGSAGLCSPGAFDAGSSSGPVLDGGALVGTQRLVPDLSAVVSDGSDINAAALVDGDAGTWWTLTCAGTAAANQFCCEPATATVSWTRSVTLTAIVIRTTALPGQIVTGQLELLRPDGGLAGLPQPILLDGYEGDYVQYFLAGPVLPQVSSIRFAPGWATIANPGISEIEVYGN
jgi:hypothetical protein